VDDLLATGPGDFVEQVSARLPLKIICTMTGAGDEHNEMVLRNTNIILPGADPESLSADLGEAVTQILTAGRELAALVTELAARRQADPGDDLTSALAAATIDGAQDPARTAGQGASHPRRGAAGPAALHTSSAASSTSAVASLRNARAPWHGGETGLTMFGERPEARVTSIS
jgi:hypothetical protein